MTEFDIYLMFASAGIVIAAFCIVLFTRRVSQLFGTVFGIIVFWLFWHHSALSKTVLFCEAI